MKKIYNKNEKSHWMTKSSFMDTNEPGIGTSSERVFRIEKEKKKQLKSEDLFKCFPRKCIKNMQLNDITAFVKSRPKISEAMVNNPECSIVPQLVTNLSKF